MKQNLLVLLSLFILLGFGCTKADPDIQIDVDVDFLIDIKENLSAAGSTLLFKTSTTDLQECLNSTIAVDFQRNNTSVRMSFLDIVTPTDCEMGSAPATASVNAGDLAVRNYEFKIDLRGEVESAGVLNIMSDRYIVSFVESSGFKFAETMLLRVPRHTVWGYVNYAEEEAETAAVFVDDLSEITAPTALEEGYYGWFKSEGSELTDMDNLPEEKINTLFVFEYEGADDDLENLISAFRAENTDIEVALFDWRGKSF